MGDRGNVKIEDSGVYLYTHWSGSELPFIVQQVLKRKERWKTYPYLTRMIFCELLTHSHNDTSHFGISTEILNNEHPIVVVNCKKQMVSFLMGHKTRPFATFSFIAFIEMSVEDLQECYEEQDEKDEGDVIVDQYKKWKKKHLWFVDKKNTIEKDKTVMDETTLQGVYLFKYFPEGDLDLLSAKRNMHLQIHVRACTMIEAQKLFDDNLPNTISSIEYLGRIIT